MLFLLKPHVVGPKGDVTTPDIVVDYMIVDGEKRPLALLTMEAWQQVSGESAQSAYGVMALGGGALLLPAVVLSSGLVVVSRGAWRLSTLDDHIAEVTLNRAPLATVGLPQTIIDAAGGSGDALPRGLLLIQTAGIGWEATLQDPVTGRELKHRVTAEDPKNDPWGNARPRPRYSVGPTQKDVTHYI
ncbi:MAG: hypothetical protein AAGJ94_10340 [Pseudomonadota bacterium]